MAAVEAGRQESLFRLERYTAKAQQVFLFWVSLEEGTPTNDRLGG